MLRALDVQGAEVSLIHADDRGCSDGVLDVVLKRSADRKGGHALEGVDGWVYGVDHGICLHEENKLRHGAVGWAGTSIADDLVADLAALARAPLRRRTAAVLAEHITFREIDALRDRVRMLVRDPVMPHPSGSRPIPWPAF